MGNYMFLLYKQYCDSVGKKYYAYNADFDTDFLYWIENHKDLVRSYLNFLAFQNIPLRGKKVEINKGAHDTLELEDSIIVSPFAPTMDLDTYILDANENSVYAINGTNEIDLSDSNLFYTHNPYSGMYINDFEYLMYLERPVLIGMFGENRDLDKNTKLEQLKNFNYENGCPCEFIYETKGDNYYGIITNVHDYLVRSRIKERNYYRDERIKERNYYRDEERSR